MELLSLNSNLLKHITNISKKLIFGGKFPLQRLHLDNYNVKSVQSALSDLKRPPERLQSQCNYRPFIT